MTEQSLPPGGNDFLEDLMKVIDIDVAHQILTTNIKGVGPFEHTVTVSLNGEGDYNSIKDACDNETTSGTLIMIQPGTYTEDPITVAAGVHLDSPTVDVVSVVASDPNTDLFTLGSFATLRQLGIVGPANAWGVLADGVSALVESIAFFSGSGAGVARNGGTLYVRHGLVGSSCDYGFRAETAGTVSAHGPVDRSSVASLSSIGVGSSVLFSSYLIEDCGDAFFVDTGGVIQGVGVDVIRPNGAVIHTGAGGGTVTVGAILREHDLPPDPVAHTGLDVWQEAGVPGSVNLLGMTLAATRLVLSDPSEVTGYGSRIGAGIDSALTVWEALHVGVPGAGREFVAGEGDVTTLGVAAYTFDGAAWVDVTTAATTESSPFDLFPNLNAGTGFYLGWNPGSPSKFPGLEFEAITRALTLGGGAVDVEYWTIGGWERAPFMVTEEVAPYEAIAEDLLLTISTGEHVRLFSQVEIRTDADEWIVSDPMTHGTPLHWLRFHISAPITQIPEVDRVKIAPDRTRMTEKGWTEKDGLARIHRRLPWDLNQFQFVAGFGAAPVASVFWPSQNIAFGFLQSTFSAGADCRTSRADELPEDMDTSHTIEIDWAWLPSDANAGNVNWHIWWTFISEDEVVPAVNPLAPHPEEQHIQVATAAPGVSRQRVLSHFELDVSQLRPRGHNEQGDILVITIQRDASGGDVLDTYGGNAVVVSFEASYLAWSHGAQCTPIT
jgi:hypothetical protein